MILSTQTLAAQQRLAWRIQHFLNCIECVTRWQYDHVEHAIEAFHAGRIAEGEEHMLKAEEPHVFRAPTDLDGGNGSAVGLQERLTAVLAVLEK